MDAKKLAMIIGISVLLPLFLVFFVDAIYSEPKLDEYCKNSIYKPYLSPKENITCPDIYYKPEVQICLSKGGSPVYDYDENNCQIYSSCDYCYKNYETLRQEYNRNIFFILAPLGLIIVLLGIYFKVDYIGAGLMFGGLITMFYATIRYFSDMSKLLRAIVLLIELIIIIYIGYKKIESKNTDVKIKKSKKSSKK
ncbi:MAG: hypothetical protein QXK76_00005 [Candidatus Woesearchaeota archaeon]